MLGCFYHLLDIRQQANTVSPMLSFSVRDLESLGASHSSSTMVLMGKVFVRGQSVQQSMRSMIVEMARKRLREGCPCLIMDSDTHATLWLEVQKPGFQSPPSNSSLSTMIERTPPPPKSSAPPLPKTTTYRGQPIEMKQPPIQPVAQPPVQPSPVPVPPAKYQLRYRGRLIEE